jgi:hypothetical protein
VFGKYACMASITAIALGVPGLYLALKGIYGSRVERVVDNALNHVCMEEPSELQGSRVRG